MLADELKSTPAAQDAELLRLAQTLADLLQQHGQPTFAFTQTGSGAMAAGEGNVAAGAGGAAVGRDVRGNLVIGSSATLNIQWAVFLTPRPPGEPDPKALLWTYLNQVVRDTAFLDLSGVDRKAATDNQETRLQTGRHLHGPRPLRREMPEKAVRADRSTK